MSEWDTSGMGSSSSVENIERLFEKRSYLNDTSRNSGFLVTIPELIRDIAPMRYGSLAEEFYKSETLQSRENERIVPSSSLSKLFIDDDDELGHMDYQSESFYMSDKFCLPRKFSKSNSLRSKLFDKEGGISGCHSELFDKEEDISGCHSRTSKVSEVPVWKPTPNLFCDMERENTKNDSAFSGRKIHRVIFSPVLKRSPLFNRKNYISTASSASYRHISRASTFFDRFRYQRIPRAAARRYLMDRDPKYKTKYN
ncbi:unnamed protein product [Onchocerca flexuosa]|uniref:Pheromone receptor n=1 Tax=Onchocerca flexuosa TaxID=387005 RepID=A0A183HFE6_9BILA|nr:unnamed protein product [Onchocerca flexuosa]